MNFFEWMCFILVITVMSLQLSYVISFTCCSIIFFFNVGIIVHIMLTFVVLFLLDVVVIFYCLYLLFVLGVRVCTRNTYCFCSVFFLSFFLLLLLPLRPIDSRQKNAYLQTSHELETWHILRT